MFEHTLLLSSKGEYHTTAETLDSVKNRMETPPEERRMRKRRAESPQRVSMRKARARVNKFRRHRTAS